MMSDTMPLMSYQIGRNGFISDMNGNIIHVPTDTLFVDVFVDGDEYFVEFRRCNPNKSIIRSLGKIPSDGSDRQEE